MNHPTHYWVEAGCPAVPDVPYHRVRRGGHLTGDARSSHCCPYFSPDALHEVPSLHMGSELGGLG